MRRYLQTLVLLVDVESHVTLLNVWRSEHCVILVGVDGHKASQVLTCLYCVNEAHILEIVDVGAMLQHDNDLVLG